MALCILLKSYSDVSIKSIIAYHCNEKTGKKPNILTKFTLTMYSLNKICFFLYCYLITKCHDVYITTYIRYENKYTYLEHKDKIPKDGQEQLVQEKPA